MAPFCLLQVLEVNQGEGPKLTRRRVDPDLTRQGSCVLVNRQDQKATNLARYAIHLHRLTHTVTYDIILVFPSPKTDLNVRVQTTSRAPFVFVFSGIKHV